MFQNPKPCFDHVLCSSALRKAAFLLIRWKRQMFDSVSLVSGLGLECFSGQLVAAAAGVCQPLTKWWAAPLSMRTVCCHLDLVYHAALLPVASGDVCVPAARRGFKKPDRTIGRNPRIHVYASHISRIYASCLLCFIVSFTTKNICMQLMFWWIGAVWQNAPRTWMPLDDT